ncbi:Teichoic acids export ATP-binding protein TagH [Rosistilla carotiformis]|uniref:Teichoic acids export ATP-binding protein TagH n=2 Tax=Rosistilla carotiformis TaxID=2528017 RepID=A0A518JLE7_9BACT|nr:Teichoic acids export ATP-binding protein TagH [Rosistilla carotiformis]
MLRKPLQRVATEEFWALKGIELGIKKGEIVGVIGCNGAGKSTLLKVLSRITEPTTGRIELFGRVGSLLEVGTGFHPELTGRENIYLNGAILGMSRFQISKQFDAIVDFAGVEKFLDTPVKRYSSGMYVRLAFAIAAHVNPDILIIDEVLAVGDAEFQTRCLRKMEEVSSNGSTVLFVSHDLNAVKSLCTRAVLLEGGSVSYDSSPEQAIQQYSSRGQFRNTLAYSHNAAAALITQLLFLSPEGGETSVIDVAAPVRILTEIEIREGTENLELCLRLELSTGVYLGSIRTPAGILDVCGQYPGRYQILLDFELPALLPQTIQLSAWLHVPKVKLYDMQERCRRIVILNSSLNHASRFDLDNGGPLGFVPTKISVDRVSTN